jgi:hypothetical protein
MCRVWRRLDRFEVFEGLAAARQRYRSPCRRSSRTRDRRSVSAAAARALPTLRCTKRDRLHRPACPLARAARCRSAQLLARFRRDPVGGPGRRQAGRSRRRRPAPAATSASRIVGDHLGGRAAGIGRRHHDLEPIASRAHVAHDAELGHRDHRDLRISARRQDEDFPAVADRQHARRRRKSSALTTARPDRRAAGTASSASRWPMCSVCTPSLPRDRNGVRAGTFSVASFSTGTTDRFPRRLERGPGDAEPAAATRRRSASREELGGVGPQVVERACMRGMRLVGAVAESAPSSRRRAAGGNAPPSALLAAMAASCASAEPASAAHSGT